MASAKPRNTGTAGAAKSVAVDSTTRPRVSLVEDDGTPAPIKLALFKQQLLESRGAAKMLQMQRQLAADMNRKVGAASKKVEEQKNLDAVRAAFLALLPTHRGHGAGKRIAEKLGIDVKTALKHLRKVRRGEENEE